MNLKRARVKIFKICNYNYELYILIIGFLCAVFSSFFVFYFPHNFLLLLLFLLARKSFSSTKTDLPIWASKFKHCCFIFVGVFVTCFSFPPLPVRFEHFPLRRFFVISRLSFSLLIIFQPFKWGFRKGLKDITIELWKLAESVHNSSLRFLFFSKFHPDT